MVLTVLTSVLGSHSSVFATRPTVPQYSKAKEVRVAFPEDKLLCWTTVSLRWTMKSLQWRTTVSLKDFATRTMESLRWVTTKQKNELFTYLVQTYISHGSIQFLTKFNMVA